MPRASKACGHFGCPTKVVGVTYCDAHRPMNWRGDPRTSTAEHKAWRRAVLERDHWRCRLKYPGCTGKATQADHKVAVTFGGATTLENGAAVCVSCHKQKTQQEALEAKLRKKMPPGATNT